MARKIRFKKIDIDWGSSFNYLFLILLSSFVLLAFLIALPLTEKLTDVVAFDLNVNEEFWSKEYILEFDSENQTEINKTKNILFKRLNRYGVEEVTVSQEDKSIRVEVKTTKPQSYVDEMIRSPYQYSIVTRKEDVDFESEENQFAPYLSENYDDTKFNSSIFRNIHITKLPTSSGELSYFGIAKIWPNKSREFKDFLTDNNEQYIGLKIDDFVTPIYINDPNLLAIPIGAEEDSVGSIDILYNSGNIPISYTLAEENDLDVSNINIDYIELTIALFISILAIYIYTYFTKLYNTNLILSSLFIVLLSLALFLTYLKITYTPIQIFILLIDAVILIMLTNLIKQNTESRYTLLIGALLIAFVFKYLGIGYIKVLGDHLIITSLIAFLSVAFGDYYINKLSIYFRK
jgi:preprotein translocase subunit SecD